MEASDEKDEACYKKLRTTFEQGLSLGEEGELNDIRVKKELSLKATAMNKAAFGEDQILPIAGAKSLAFIQCSYLPYYISSPNIDITWKHYWEKALIILFASDKTEEYAFKQARLEKAIETFSKENPKLAAEANKILKQIETQKTETTEPMKSPESDAVARLA